MTITSRERVVATLRGEAVDRPPFALWRHFHDAEEKGARELADAMIGWARTYGFDLLKYNPRARYHAEPFDGRLPTRPAPLDHPTFREMLDGLRLVRSALSDLPILMTIFTPLAVCAYIVGRDRFRAVLDGEPDRVEAALPPIAETFAAFATACLEAGADGIFLATLPLASRDATSDREYARFGRPYDVRILEAVPSALNVLHVCGERTRVLELADYPHVAALSWNVHGAGNPGLAEGLATGRVVVGGLSDRALLSADDGLARAEIGRGLVETGGRGWIAAGGCTIPPESSDRAIRAAGDALG